MKRIVSITPCAILRDSRTYKQACSFARWGYESIVVEGQPSPPQNTSQAFSIRSLECSEAGGGRENRDARGGVTGRIKGGIHRILGILPAPIHHSLRISLSCIQYIKRNLWNYRKAIPKASLYVLHGYEQFPIVYLLSRWYGVSYIYDAHDFYSQIKARDSLNDYECYYYQPFFRWIESLCIHHASAMCTVSPGLVRLYKDEFSANALLLRNVHDFRLEEAPAQGIKDFLGLSESDFLIVTVGQAKAGMAISTMLEAMQSLPQHIHLAFLGRNYSELDTLESLPDDLYKRIHLVEAVKPSEVVPFIRSADAGLVLYLGQSPNLKYALPNGFFQVLAAKLPVLYPPLPDIEAIAAELNATNPIDLTNAKMLIQKILDIEKEHALPIDPHPSPRELLSWEQEERILHQAIHAGKFTSNGLELAQ